jgi:hypothetical protein
VEADLKTSYAAKLWLSLFGEAGGGPTELIYRR